MARRLGSQLDRMNVTQVAAQHAVNTVDGKTVWLGCVATASNGDDTITWTCNTEDAPNLGDPVTVHVGWTSRESTE
jgi:hypothetical protein